MSQNLQGKKDIIQADFCVYKNDIEYVDKLISIYSIIKMDADKQLRDFEKEVLNFYVRFGYSTETKKKIKKTLKKTDASITQANFHLSKKGYLVPSKRNLSQKNLNPDLQRIHDNLVSGKKKIWAIGFKRKKWQK